MAGTTKYLVRFATGTTVGLKDATIVRLSDGKEVPFLNPPFRIIDITTSDPVNPVSRAVLVIKRDGFIEWTSSFLHLYLATLQSKLKADVVITGTPQQKVEFQGNVLVAPSASETYNIIIETIP